MEQNYLIWVRNALTLCVNAFQSEDELMKKEFAELAEAFSSFRLQEKLAAFELMENSLQNNHMAIVNIYSCIIQNMELQEFEKPIMNHLLTCEYGVFSGCMMELQVMRVIKGCYSEKRSLHRRNVQRLKQEVGQDRSYIPAKSRNSKRIVIITEQLLSPLHAPTAVVYNIAFVLKKYMHYEVFIFICPCDGELSTEMWYRFRYSDSMDGFRNKLINTRYKDEIFAGYQINMDMPDCIQKYGMMLSAIEEWNPAFVLGLGVVNPILDLVNEFTTVASMAMSATCPVSDSEILFRLAKQKEEIEREYEAALRQNQSQIFMETTLPVFIEKQISGNPGRKELGLPLDKFIIAIVGNRLEQEIDVKFIELMKSILIEYPDCVFAIAGAVTRLKDYFAGGKYQDRIFYLGFCSDLFGTYKVMDLYLNPQRAGGGWSSAMALMAGIPVVTLPNCDVAYNVGEKFIVSDYVEMKAIINRYMTEPDFMKKMKQYAAERGAENTEEKMIKFVQSMVDGIEAVLEGSK